MNNYKHPIFIIFYKPIFARAHVHLRPFLSLRRRRFVDAEAVDADAVGSGCCSRRSSAASSSLAPVPVAASRERSTSLMGTCCIYSRKSGDFTNKTRNFVGIVADFCWRSWYILQFKPPFVWKSHSPKMPTV